MLVVRMLDFPASSTCLQQRLLCILFPYYYCCNIVVTYWHITCICNFPTIRYIFQNACVEICFIFEEFNACCKYWISSFIYIVYNNIFCILFLLLPHKLHCCSTGTSPNVASSQPYGTSFRILVLKYVSSLRSLMLVVSTDFHSIYIVYNNIFVYSFLLLLQLLHIHLVLEIQMILRSLIDRHLCVPASATSHPYGIFKSPVLIYSSTFVNFNTFGKY